MNKLHETRKLLEEILAEAETLVPNKISNEILAWVADNVVYFIDNKSKRFKLDLIVDESKADIFPETNHLQNLYRKLPDENSDTLTLEDAGTDWTNSLSPEENEIMSMIGECRSKLDNVTQRAFQHMNADYEALGKIYKKMIYFYEIKGINQGQFLLQNLEGGVEILRFDYEAFSVPVVVTKNNLQKNEDGTISVKDVETISQYVIPEGFSLWIEISMRPPRQQHSIF